jgi:hypothetical protein
MDISVQRKGLTNTLGGYAIGAGIGFVAQSSARNYMQYEQR